MISYKPLLKLMIDRDVSKLQLKDDINISSTTLAKFGKNEPVSLTIIDKLCAYFKCQPSDLIEYIPDESSEINE
ncbi:helix-turn-helix domain-containing protein [Bacillus cereus]|nr:helix-turn-helix domain-containing protein [Bacillus albus]